MYPGKKIRLIFFALLTSNFIQAQDLETVWQDEKATSINREPMHATYFAFENRDLAAMGVKEHSNRFIAGRSGSGMGTTAGERGYYTGD